MNCNWRRWSIVVSFQYVTVHYCNNTEGLQNFDVCYSSLFTRHLEVRKVYEICVDNHLSPGLEFGRNCIINKN